MLGLKLDINENLLVITETTKLIAQFEYRTPYLLVDHDLFSLVLWRVKMATGVSVR